MRENLKISIIIKNVIVAEDTMMHSAESVLAIFFNTFTHNQAEQIKRE